METGSDHEEIGGEKPGSAAEQIDGHSRFIPTARWQNNI
jgi:hypothetical protein